MTHNDQMLQHSPGDFLKPRGAAMPSTKVLRAINVAALCHEGQLRKGTRLPYISHVFGVYAITCALTEREDVRIAALLHDVVEDAPERYSFVQMEVEFGPKVAGMVRAVTKDASISNWWERNRAYLGVLNAAKTDPGAVLVALADKTHNLQSILQDYAQVGEALWERFKTGKQGVAWWYRANLELFERRIPKALEASQYPVLCAQLEVITGEG
ncbi:HD domain-containing protein [Corynebacterium kozikiae]|uniref:HD domain-containing protein n=1 Tax=Corynebacterium kozikiae TaxID=2968469 RepID=UPI00211BBB93|nr:HD domain-containing protein [Corynebacterium sp. 76QC2CO]